MTSAEIRRQFIDFFVQKHAHTYVASSPVVPQSDPTLLFTNAGMNQFKPIFLGLESRPYTRAANTQKCIRAGGKHNDLDDVGRSPRHHTFFEMLGNWSFGDYFKRGAIEMAWELLTQVWKIDPTRLHVSVYKGNPADNVPPDDEAAQLWKEIAGLPDDHIHRFVEDNFWEMGETGPCGPCSEIYIDRTPDKSGGPRVNTGDPQVMEIWNLVFIQYNRAADRSLSRLPAQHIDTGMGFERMCQVLQDQPDNYATDLFAPLLTAIAGFSGAVYRGAFAGPDVRQLEIDTAFRVIADHARMATFAITDGAVPSNKKRGAVVRSVIRRAVRFGYQVMNLREPFLHRLVPVLAGQMGDVFPELRKNPSQVAAVIRAEEADFLANIDRGLQAFEDAAGAAKATGIFPGKDIFYLHSTLGFPADMTMQLAAQRGLKPDRAEFDRLNDDFRKTSGQGRRQHSELALDLTSVAKTDDSAKYLGLTTDARILAWVTDSAPVLAGRLDEDASAALLLDRTVFYAEQGGQVGDIGLIQTPTGSFEVTATERKGDWVLHWGLVSEGHLEPGQPAQLAVDRRRLDTMRNHTATHLLNWALQKVLGPHIEQQGSLVDPDKLRFDFTNPTSVPPDQLAVIERLVNEEIYADLPIRATVMPLAEARKLPGVRAVFAEKYPDPVRVVAVADFDDAVGTRPASGAAKPGHSAEFCGGTHLAHTGQAGPFKIVSEEAVSKAVRRITALTGPRAVEYIQTLAANLRQVAHLLSVPADEAPKRLAALQDELKQLRKKPAVGGGSGGGADPIAATSALLKDAPALGPGKLVVGSIPGATDEQLRTAVDSLKKKAGSYAILLASTADDKITFVAAVSDDIIALGLKAGDWARDVAKVAGGSGGGRPQMAQAGAKDPSKLPVALDAARNIASKIG